MADTDNFYRIHHQLESAKKTLRTGYAGIYTKKEAKAIIPDLKVQLADTVSDLGFNPLRERPKSS